MDEEIYAMLLACAALVTMSTATFAADKKVPLKTKPAIHKIAKKTTKPLTPVKTVKKSKKTGSAAPVKKNNQDNS